MKRLAFWAKAHPLSARWAIAAGRTSLGVAGFASGVFAAVGGQLGGPGLFAASGLLYLAAFLAYPAKGGPKRSFRWRKSCDGALVASSFLFWVAVGNVVPEQCAAGIPASHPSGLVGGAPPVSMAAVEPVAAKERFGFLKKTRAWRALQERGGKLVAAIREARARLNPALGFLLVVLTLAFIVGVGYLTASLSCTLSCNGQEAAAGLVVVAGVVVGLGVPFLVWRAVILRSRRNS